MLLGHERIAHCLFSLSGFCVARIEFVGNSTDLLYCSNVNCADKR